MNIRTFLFCSQFTILSLVDTAYSQLSPRLPDLGFRWTPGKVFVPAGNSGALLAKVKKDTMVTTRFDLFFFSGNDWIKTSYNLCTYDARGRLIESATHQNSFLSGNDTIIGRLTYEYDLAGTTCRSTTTGMGQSFDSLGVSNIDSVYSVTSFYPANSYNITTAAPFENTTSGWPDVPYDSMKACTIARDSITGLWDTVIRTDSRCIGGNATPLRIVESISGRGKTGAIVSVVYESVRLPGSDSQTDTFLTKVIAREGKPVGLIGNMVELIGEGQRTINRYDTRHRLVAQTTESLNSTTKSWVKLINNLANYSASGAVDTTWMQTWDSVGGSWVNLIKTVYTFSTISLFVKNIPKLRNAVSELSCTWRENSLHLRSATDLRISSVVRYDLRGRVMDRYDVSNMVNRYGEYLVPLSHTSRSISMVAVQTDRGTYLLKNVP